MTHSAATDQPTTLPPALDAMTLLVAAVIVHDLNNDQVVLLQRGPHAKFAQGMWDLPVGKALPGEPITITLPPLSRHLDTRHRHSRQLRPHHPRSPHQLPHPRPQPHPPRLARLTRLTEPAGPGSGGRSARDRYGTGGRLHRRPRAASLASRAGRPGGPRPYARSGGHQMNSTPPLPDGIAVAKRALRERIWRSLDRHGAFQPPGAAGHIPAFVGADAAADRLAGVSAWTAAHVIKANPDRAQLPVRMHALHAGKTVYMAVPRLESVEPFYLLDPSQIGSDADLRAVATGTGAASGAPRVRLEQMRPIDRRG